MLLDFLLCREAMNNELSGLSPPLFVPTVSKDLSKVQHVASEMRFSLCFKAAGAVEGSCETPLARGPDDPPSRRPSRCGRADSLR